MHLAGGAVLFTFCLFKSEFRQNTTITDRKKADAKRLESGWKTA